MKRELLIISAILAIGITVYMLLPVPDFPPPPPNAVQSVEPADSEDLSRRAYFTNYTREQVIDHYRNQFRYQPFIIRLNYPPEDAQTIIRDQTRSVYLEELVHPLRESLYINGFIPREPKDDIWYHGVHYEEKITIKYVTSPFYLRLPIALASVGMFLFVSYQYFKKS